MREREKREREAISSLAHGNVHGSVHGSVRGSVQCHIHVLYNGL